MSYVCYWKEMTEVCRLVGVLCKQPTSGVQMRHILRLQIRSYVLYKCDKVRQIIDIIQILWVHQHYLKSDCSSVDAMNGLISLLNRI